MSPHKIIQSALELHRQYYFSGVIIEAIGGSQIYEPMMHELTMGDEFYSQYPFAPTFVKHQEANKKDRIYAGLQPRMAIGQILIRAEMEEFKNECEMFDSIESPHLLDALEFGNRNSTDCIEDLWQPETRLDRRRRDRAQAQRDNWRNWAPSNLADVVG
jgi:hypothetical protein